MTWEIGCYSFTRFVFQRLLGLIYLVAFLIVVNQFKGLCGDQGLLPVRLFVKRVDFWDSPSLFWFKNSDSFMMTLAWIGLALALAATVGISDLFGTWLSVLIWALLWVIYLSFVNVGQTFYGFGWEMLILETGFLAIFLGPLRAPAALILILLIRWVLFRIMFGAGLIKIRGDTCWRDLTCLQYHYETQPMPNALSWYFHHLPQWVLRLGVVFNHFVELIVPFGFFGPRYVRIAAGLITIAFQLNLIFSGNLSWLNCLTIVLCFACFDDAFYNRLISLFTGSGNVFGNSTGGGSWFASWSVPPSLSGIPLPVIYGLLAVVLLLSIKPTINLFSSSQMMNSSFDPFHLVNTYGAFGSITRERYEIVMEGTDASVISPETQWLAYEFKGKPGDSGFRPPQVTPYHYKLDWQMWFAAMGSYQHYPWIVNLVAKMLGGQKDVLSLLRVNPFADHPPKYVRAQLYLYRFTDPGEKPWWKRELVGTYLPPLSLDDKSFRAVLREQGWL